MDSAAPLLDLILGYRTSQAIHVAAVLGVSDHLAAGPRTLAELASATETDSRSLYRLLRALATIGLYEELPDGRFVATAMGEQLRRDADPPLANIAAQIGTPSFWQAWGSLEHSVRTGENAFAFVHGQSIWEHRRQYPEEGTVFDAAMTAQSRRVADAVVDAYDFGTFATVADIGGGRGAMLAAILNRYADVRGVLFDQPQVVAGATTLLEQAGVAARCDIVEGDFFDAVPAGAGAYVLKSVVHDWNDEQAVDIIRVCRRVMTPDSALLILERALGAPPYSPQMAASAISDLNMLVAPGGQERTPSEYEALLATAGLRMTRVVPTASDFAVFEARV